MEQEELTCLQRARANLLKHGDQNTSSFNNLPLVEGRDMITGAWLMNMG
jgi:hypothetical protein